MKTWTLAFILLMLFASVAYPETVIRRGVVFYGEQCPLCGEYGYCRRTPTQSEAVSILNSYYGKRGFRVIVIRRKERFLEAEIDKDGNTVDRVLLDLRTGRMRSLY